MVVGELVEERDLVIIGGGPGGYTAAIRAAQLGLKPTLIERNKLGGSCLHVGCIPSKLWAHAGKKYSELNHLKEIGITPKEVTYQLDKLLTYQKKVINQLEKGIIALCKANQVEVIEGSATFLAEDRIGVENGHKFDTYRFKQAIIATGSNIAPMEEIPTDRKRIYHADEIYQITELPSDLIVYGDDYISLEVASSFRALGVNVKLLFPHDAEQTLDETILREMERLFKKRKLKIMKEVELLNIEEDENEVHIEANIRGKKETLTGSHLFMSGRNVPNVNELGIDRVGMERNDDGTIVTNDYFQTSIPNIYAIGDVTDGEQLAVKAIKQGKLVAEHIAGENVEWDRNFLPTVIHTNPPIVSVGLTEAEAKEYEIDVTISQIPLQSNGYAQITGNKDGIVKVISEKDTTIIQGIHMIGEGAIELASSFVQSLEMVAKEEDLTFPFYPHPSINEGFLEAVEEMVGQAIHVAPPRVKQKV